MKTIFFKSIFIILFLILDTKTYGQYRKEIIEDINNILGEVKNVTIQISDSHPKNIKHTYMKLSEHASKKDWVTLTTVTSWGGNYADLTLTYSFDPKTIKDFSMNDEVDKERRNKAFLFAINCNHNAVEMTSDQGGNNSRNKASSAVVYIMMKGRDGYENYDELKELFSEFAYND